MDFSIPPDNHWEVAYPWMIERLTKALQKGQMNGMRGLLFFQTASGTVKSSGVTLTLP